jgi:hypothetical protein
MTSMRRIALRVFIALVVVAVSYAGWTRVRSPVSMAHEDANRLWIALIKGFEGDVRYVGSDETSAYFRVGLVFSTYYKVPACAVQLPETFAIGHDRSYVVRPHTGSGYMSRVPNACVKYEGHTLGRLDRS